MKAVKVQCYFVKIALRVQHAKGIIAVITRVPYLLIYNISKQPSSANDLQKRNMEYVNDLQNRNL